MADPWPSLNEDQERPHLCQISVNGRHKRLFAAGNPMALDFRRNVAECSDGLTPT